MPAMRFIFTLFSIMFLSSVAHSTTCEDVFIKNEVSANTIKKSTAKYDKTRDSFPTSLTIKETSFLIDLPAELRTPVLEALGGTAEIKNNWTVEAARNLVIMGASKHELETYLGVHLEEFLQQGRNMGLNKDFSISELPNLDNSIAKINPKGRVQLDSDYLKNLVERHELNDFNKLLYRLDLTIDNRVESRSVSSTYYIVALDSIFAAAEIGKMPERSKEAFMYLLRLGDFNDAARSAQIIGNHSLALLAGKLSLTKYLYHTGYHNDLWYAIDILQKIQGPDKAEANALLIDTAKYLMSETYKSKLDDPMDYANTALSLGFWALASTGELVMKINVDTTRVNYVTRIKDEYTKKVLKKLFIIARGIDFKDVITDQLLQAAYALNDSAFVAKFTRTVFNSINMRSEKALRKFNMVFSLALISNDIVLLNAILDKAYANGYDIYPSLFNELLIIEDSMLRAATSKINSLRRNTDDFKQNNNQTYTQKKARLKEYKVIKKDDSYDSTLKSVKQVTIEKELATAVKRPMEERLELSAMGYKMMSSNLLEAYVLFLSAADINGLIAVGKKRTEHNDGLNAINPLSAAAILMSSSLTLTTTKPE